MNSLPYVQHKGKAIEDSRFKYMMAITLDPRSNYKKGIIRCITSREGSVEISGYVDRSELYIIEGDSLEHFKVTRRLNIKNENELVSNITPQGWDFIGLEDPDIWIDKETSLMHVYFTIPIRPPKDSTEIIKIHLGHAIGKDLDSLEMTEPVLMANHQSSAKEISIAPVNQKQVRLNLIESRDPGPEASYSVVKIAIAEDMGKPWQYGEVAFHPREQNLSWIGGHASPAPLLPKTFIDIGEGKMLGIINGREADQRSTSGSTKYGMFSVGLFIYDYEHGKIEWVSPEPLIRDSEAVTITFASQFVETAPGEGILYAHVDDSFVRAYSLNASAIRALLP